MVRGQEREEGEPRQTNLILKYSVVFSVFSTYKQQSNLDGGGGVDYKILQLKHITTVQILALQNIYISSSFITFNISSSL